ncbi:MAG: glucosamine-6-phosphate deaminase [Parcubacteria group bacterium Gr01-1014_38]|nr:MAG: glucosamine-6-phosphate deaminase [Parcubacteria group bacterium Gr01-1014_38]
MSVRILYGDTKDFTIPIVGTYVIDWCVAHPGDGLGGATGNSPVPLWAYIWSALAGDRSADREAVTSQEIFFLDEYVGAFPSYHHWAWRNLRVGRGGFEAKRVHVPRGCFVEQTLGREHRIVTSDALDMILDATRDSSSKEAEWEPRTEDGEDGFPPEVRILECATHPVLCEIRDSMRLYDTLVRSHNRRLQVLGIGVGGAIDRDPEVGGHIGFVECGAAAEDTGVMLVRLAASTVRANADDFVLKGDALLEPVRFAITQGIATILSAGELLLLAWGAGKQEAVERMLLGTPGPQNPAAWVQDHAHVTLVLDQAAFGDLDAAVLGDRGFTVEFPTVSPVVS